MKRKNLLIILVLLLFGVFATGLGVTYAFYQTEVTGAVSGKTSDYAGEVEIVSDTHTDILPAASTAVDVIEFYVKNYTGSDANPTNTSEVYLSYELTFTLPTWGSGCTNPVSYKLFQVNESTNAETEITLTGNKTSAINFSMLSAEKDMYRLKLYWDTAYNAASCYAGKTGSVGIAANIYQTNV